MLAAARTVPRGCQATGLRTTAPGLGGGELRGAEGLTCDQYRSGRSQRRAGVGPGTAVTGLPAGVMNGTICVGDAFTMQAQNDVTTAYTVLTSQPCDFDLTGWDGE